MASERAPAPGAPDETDPSAGMPLLAHLDELRKRLLWSAVGVAVAFGLACMKADELFRFCERPYRLVVAEPLSVIEVTEAFFIKLRVAFLASLFVSAPWTLAQAWGFISPGLHPHERRWAVPFVVVTSVFFLAGGAFGYLVGIPAMLKFLLGQAASGFELDVRAASYISTFSRVVLAMGIVFEMPVATFALARLGLLDHRWMLRKIRHAVVIIAVLAAVVTPSGDIPTMLVFAVPMVALYVLSIGVAWAFRRRAEPEAA